MDIQKIISDLGASATQLIQQYLPDLPAEAIQYGGGTLLAALAFFMLLFAFRLMRSAPKNRPAQRINVPRVLQQEGVVIDLLNSVNDEDIAVRCVITSVSSGKIKCEIIERLDVIKTKEGKEIVCIFAPMKANDTKVNSFTAKLIESDKTGKDIDRLILSAPSTYAMIPRRKHTRKRVADQQFIRVKLWIDNPYSSDISFEDAAPHIGVNSFSPDGPDQSANAVVNISNGGLGLSIQNRAIPETCAVGASIAINLFMFNFKEKSFKPYWYTGEVRSMEEGRPGFTRMGIQFNGNGKTCNDTGCVRWEKF